MGDAIFSVTCLTALLVAWVWLAKVWREHDPAQRRLEAAILGGTTCTTIGSGLDHYRLLEPLSTLFWWLSEGFITYTLVLTVRKKRADHALKQKH